MGRLEKYAAIKIQHVQRGCNCKGDNLACRQLIKIEWRKPAPKPSKLDSILFSVAGAGVATVLAGVDLLELMNTPTYKTAKADFLSLVEEVIGPDIEDDPYMTVVNGTKAIQRLRKDNL